MNCKISGHFWGIAGAPPRAVEGARVGNVPWSLSFISLMVNLPLTRCMITEKSRSFSDENNDQMHTVWGLALELRCVIIQNIW